MERTVSAGAGQSYGSLKPSNETGNGDAAGAASFLAFRTENQIASDDRQAICCQADSRLPRFLANQDDAGLGERDGERVGPGESGQELLRGWKLGRADEEGEASVGGEAGGNREDAVEVFDGPEGDGGARRKQGVLRLGCASFAPKTGALTYWRILAQDDRGFEVFGAGGGDGDVMQVEGADDFLEKCRFAMLGLDERDGQLGTPDLDGQAGKAGAGADIQEAHGTGLMAHGEENLGGEQGFAEVAGDDLLGVVDGGEVHARVPAMEDLEIGGELG